MENNVLASSTAARAARTTKSRVKDERHDLHEITFPQGLIGCPDWHQFELIPDPFETCGQLISLDQSGVGLIVADPIWLGINFHFELDEDDVDALNLTSADDARVLCILTLHRDPPLITANLAGPIILNWSERRGRQVILDHLAYPLRAPVISGEAARVVIDALAGAERDTIESASPTPHPLAPAPKKGA